jgi:chromosome segregation ATPase
MSYYYYFPYIRKFLALAGIGLSGIGILVVIITYLVLAPAITSLHQANDAQFTQLDSIMLSVETSLTNASTTVKEKPAAALSDVNDALLAYGESSEDLASSIESVGAILPLPQIDSVAEKLRSSSTSIRSASKNLMDMKSSLNSTATDINGVSAEIKEYRQELTTTHSQISSVFNSLHTAIVLLAFIGFLGFLTQITLCTALLFE